MICCAGYMRVAIGKPEDQLLGPCGAARVLVGEKRNADLGPKYTPFNL